MYSHILYYYFTCLVLDSHGSQQSDSSHATSRDLGDQSISPESLVEKLVLCLPANLESCHSLSSKSKLLSCAIKCGDGEAILAVSLTKLNNSKLYIKISSSSI
jgi:hypothetical protein